MRLLMWIAVIDSVIFSNQFFTAYICKFNLPEIYVLTAFWRPATVEYRLKALLIFYQDSTFIELFGLYFSICLNICLQIDLILMIRNPFKDKSNNIKFYVGICLLVSTVASSICTITVNQSFSAVLTAK